MVRLDMTIAVDWDEHQTKPNIYCSECSGSVVECLSRDRGVVGSCLIGVTALCP